MMHRTRLNSFGSSCHITLQSKSPNAPSLLSRAQQEFGRLESKFSSFVEGSLISDINRAAGTGAYIPLDAEARSLLAYVQALWVESNHIFDPTTRLLQHCYDEGGRLTASAQQLKDLLSLVGWSGLEVADEGARLSQKGMLIDLNSSIRPYAVDSVRKLLVREGIEHALIEMDRDMASIGKQADGANWLVGTRHPRGQRMAITRLKLNGKGYAMRGDFERRVSLQGENFGRALSPVDGYPIPGMLSVIVIADNCLTACSAASVARLKTEKAAINWLKELGLPWMAIDRGLNCHGPLAPDQP